MHRPAASTRLASAPAAVTTAGRGSVASAGEVGAANVLGEAIEDRFARRIASAGEVGAANALGEAVEDRFARNSLFRLAAAWRACPKAEASLPDDGAGPLFEAAAANEPVAVARAARGRSSSR